MKADRYLDAKGLACPMPIVQTKKAMKDMQTGEVLEVHTTDQGARSDLAAWAKSSGNELLHGSEEQGVLKFWLKKG
ncbi:sulfurtransferase TusA family protein [Paenibacillus albicereus]|nr:sulfurtransferase TusA family protein [Paenibacillus albicereus]